MCHLKTKAQKSFGQVSQKKTYDPDDIKYRPVITAGHA